MKKWVGPGFGVTLSKEGSDGSIGGEAKGRSMNSSHCHSLFIHNAIANGSQSQSHSCYLSLRSGRRGQPSVRCCREIDMVKTSEGTYAAKAQKVVVLWDLDNKPPRGPPYDAALSLKTLASRFGHLVDFSAYANRHAFLHLPQWVLHDRRIRRHLDVLERKGAVAPSEPYTCGVCGRKCGTHLALKRHFQQLHVRERQKKLNRLRSLKGRKQRERFKERFLRGNHKYDEAARTLVVPKVGYGLAAELRRAGVFVKTVRDKPQAADWALKRQMVHSMSRGIDWLFLVSDDSDFSEMLRRAREAHLGTVVVGDWDRALGRHADFWVSWTRVQNGEVDLLPKGRKNPVFDDRHHDGVFLNDEEQGFGEEFMLYSEDEDEDEDLDVEDYYDEDEEDEEEEDGFYIY
ncbi:hypothetical protein Fmac_032392 [Flemingia macrophylla]|uniref:C2H2-type domain-containing protein n=1 Tax=Flemingia macrophylla TaxID=520843 RepID=A0ABD1L4T5_9FABA